MKWKEKWKEGEEEREEKRKGVVVGKKGAISISKQAGKVIWEFILNCM